MRIIIKEGKGELRVIKIREAEIMSKKLTTERLAIEMLVIEKKIPFIRR